MRVAAENPEVSDAERKTFVDPDPATWRFLKLRLPKNQSTDSGTASSLVLTPALATDFVAIDLLRPLEWLEKQGAKVGGRVYLDLQELGAKGWAEVLEIGPCPEIVPGPGSVVTATFAHQPTSEILDVTISVARQSTGGLTLDQPSSQDTSLASEIIGVTANHPFWSVDHQAFVPVGLLEPGTRVKTHLDQIQTIVSLHPRPGPPEKVYNLEVHSEHVYYVGQSSVLVHNACADELRKAMNRAGVYGDNGAVPHHMVSRFDKRADDARRILGKHNIDLDSHWNGVFLPTRGSKARGAIHNNLHTNDYYAELTRRLSDADLNGGRAGVLRELQRIRSDLIDGSFSSIPVRHMNF